MSADADAGVDPTECYRNPRAGSRGALEQLPTDRVRRGSTETAVDSGPAPLISHAVRARASPVVRSRYAHSSPFTAVLRFQWAKRASVRPRCAYPSLRDGARCLRRCRLQELSHLR